MKIRKQIASLPVCLLILLITGIIAFADTIRLKDGSVLKGKVISYNQRKFTIVVYIGGTSSQHVIPIEEIESVDFDSSDPTASARGGSSSVSTVPVDQGVSRKEPSLQPLSSDTSFSTTSSRGSNQRPTLPPENPPPPTETETGNSGVVAAEKTINVAAAADWTSTEIRVQRGQRIVITASGEVELGENRRTGPEGLSVSDNRKLVPNRPTGALIGVVGDDNDDFIHIGGSGDFIAPHNGILFLSVNEGNLKDNNGTFVARVKVMSTR